MSAWGKEMWRNAAATAPEFLLKRSRNCDIRVFNLRHAVRILALCWSETWGENEGWRSSSNGRRWKHLSVLETDVLFLCCSVPLFPGEKTSRDGKMLVPATVLQNERHEWIQIACKTLQDSLENLHKSWPGASAVLWCSTADIWWGKERWPLTG